MVSEGTVDAPAHVCADGCWMLMLDEWLGAGVVQGSSLQGIWEQSKTTSCWAWDSPRSVPNRASKNMK